jgi:HupE / UreJ protein
MARSRGRQSALPVIVAVTAVLATVSGAFAHDRTTSYSSWHLSGRQATVVLRVNEVDIAALPWASGEGSAFDSALARYGLEHLTLLAGEQTCAASEPPHRLQAPVGRLALEWRVACPAEGPLSLRSDVLFDTRSGHVHFASLHSAGGSAERVLSNAERVWRLEGEAGAAGASSSSLGSYWLLGVEHIATGYDHLVFLLALLLMGGTFMSLAKVVSGFTVGHSLTLGLASLGLVRPEIASIEALIGLSIVLVAVENVWLLGPRSYPLPMTITALLALLGVGAARGLGLVSSLSFLGLGLFLGCYFPLLRRNPRAESARWAIALLFGLIHGFGFASVLRAADLSAERLVGALLSFNLGVEAGQLALVAMAWPLLRFALARWGNLVIEVGSAATIGFGVYWFVARTYF